MREALRDSDLVRAKTPREVGGLALDLTSQYRLFSTAARDGHPHGRFVAHAAGLVGQLGARLSDAGVDKLFGTSGFPLVVGIGPERSSWNLPSWAHDQGVLIPDWAVIHTSRTSHPGRIRAVVVPCDALATDHGVGRDPEVDPSLIIERSVRPNRGGHVYNMPLEVYLAPETLGYTMACGRRLLEEFARSVSCSADALGSRLWNRSDALLVLENRARRLDLIDEEIVNFLDRIDRLATAVSSSHTLQGSQRRTAAVVVGRLRREIRQTVMGDVVIPGPLRGGMGQNEVTVFDGLTSREWEILSRLTTRDTLDEIAARLYISPNTLKSHLKSLYRKIGVASRREAADLVECSGRTAS